MLILAKSAMAMMLGFIISTVFGYLLIPLLKKMHVGQHVSHMIGERHLAKEGTPTLGGLIFIIPTTIVIILLILRNSLEFNTNLQIVLFVFIAYAALGFIDDYLKLRFNNNKGLSITTKLLIQTFIALVFFYLYMSNGGEPTLEITSLHLKFNMGWGYGLFILFLLVGTTNAVNISDGLDGLCGGLSFMAFFAFAIICWGTTWIAGTSELAVFCFVLMGCILGFLVFNTNPAKVFMGDTGSLALGGALASIAILSKHELSLAVVGGVFVIEALSSIIQIFLIRKCKRKIFLMAPLHHHFEKLGWTERDIVKLFWIVGFLLAMAAITYGVWI